VNEFRYLGFLLYDLGYLNAHWMSLKSPIIGLLMQSSEESAEQRLRCNWFWANLHRFCCMALKPVH